MPVSGVVICCATEKLALLENQIIAMDGIEVRGTLPDGKIVAVIEADSVETEVDIVSQLHELDGVSTVRMAYHNFEDVA